MNNSSILIVGACTITGYHTPPTLALPIQIKRAFKNNPDVDVSITSNTSCVHNQTLEQMYAVLESELELRKFDIVILQFFNHYLSRLSAKKTSKWDRRKFKYLKSIAKRLPPQLGQELYSRYASSFIDSEYKTKLSKCVELVQNYNQDCHVFLMTPIAPTHKKICYMTEVFYKHYQLVHQVADCYSGVKVADIYTPLKVCSSGEVYQADGTHLTDKGQKVVAEAIIKNLETVIKKGLK